VKARLEEERKKEERDGGRLGQVRREKRRRNLV